MTSRRRPGRFCAVFLLLAATLAGVLAGLGPARAASVYEVKGVNVDVTAETATVAREQALAEAHAKAFRRLLERMTLAADRPRLPAPGPEAAAAYVQDFAIASEKRSATRYIAVLDFRFKRDEVRRLLMDRDIPFAETPAKPVLVLSVLERAGAFLLWDTPNPWRDAWEAAEEHAGLVPLILPLGDLSDIATIGPEQAIRGDGARLDDIAGRYEAGGALVAHGVMGLEPGSGLPALDVSLTWHGSALGEHTVVRSFVSDAGESMDALMTRAARELSVQVEEDWKRENLLQLGRQGVLAVRVPVRGLSDWVQVRRRLSGIAVIRMIDVVLMSVGEVRVNLHFNGTADQLAVAVRQADLSLRQGEGDWILTPAGTEASDPGL